MARRLPHNILQRWEYWKEQLRQWRQSGLSQAEFCRRNGLTTQQLSKWKIKLRNSHKPESISKSKSSKSSDTDRFVEVRLTDHIQQSYQISLANGRSLQIPNNYDVQVISELITIMEQTC